MQGGNPLQLNDNFSSSHDFFKGSPRWMQIPLQALLTERIILLFKVQPRKESEKEISSCAVDICEPLKFAEDQKWCSQCEVGGKERGLEDAIGAN